MQLVPATEYYTQVLQKIRRAKRRIVLAAMVVLWGEQTDAVFQALGDAVERGVKVHVLLDNYTKIPFFQSAPNSQFSRRSHISQTVNSLRRLQSLGARISYVGKIGLNPYKGRCHVKITVIDDDYYSFGGVNFSDASFSNADYMFYGRNSALADELALIVERISQLEPPLDDLTQPINDHATLLFDGGKPRSSAIFDKACELAAQAKKIYFVSQMCPSGELGRLITKTENHCYFNRFEQGVVPDKLGMYFDQRRYNIKNLYKRPGYIHAKFILFELQDGSKALVSGSNNFSYRGIAFGTQEIALYSNDPKMWQQLYDFWQRFVV